MAYSSLIGAPVQMPLDGAAYEAKLKELIATSSFVKDEVAVTETDMTKSFG